MNEYKENHDAACKSMLEYLMTGKGQEAAVKQAELSNVIYAAIQENLTEIPEVKKVYEELREEGFSVGGDAFSNDIGLIEKVLQVSDDGAYIFASKIREQIETNIMAMLKSHSTKFNYDCKPLLDDIAQFHRNVIKNKDELAKSGWECTGKTIVDYHPLKSYYTFVNKQDGTIWDLSIADTACHYFGCGRRTDADGKVSGTIVSWKLG